MMARHVISVYFSAVALGTIAWWVSLFASEQVRSLFFRKEDQDWMLAFLIPDLIIYVSIPLAIALRPKHCRTRIALHLGGALYATAFTWGYTASTGAGLLGALLMSASLVVPFLLLREPE